MGSMTMRKRRQNDATTEAEASPTKVDTMNGANDAGICKGSAQNASLLRARCLKDFLARLCFVGIFVTENMLHSAYFELEVDTMVHPALAPLPREVAVAVHVVLIVFGFFGAIFVLLSSFDTAGRTALTKGTSMMLVFMGIITWTWWINRHGKPYWQLDPYPFWDLRCSAEKKNRTVHILKNVSIVGALTVFICFGPGVVAYSSTILVGYVPWEVIVFTVPTTLYVIAILQANNYRDMEADQRTGARTVAILLGPMGSLAYYGLLLCGAHAGAVAAGYWYNCLGATASLLVLPQSIWLCVRIRNQATLRTQDEETAKSAMMFGVALALGIITMPGSEFSMHGFGATALVVVVLKLFAD